MKVLSLAIVLATAAAVADESSKVSIIDGSTTDVVAKATGPAVYANAEAEPGTDGNAPVSRAEYSYMTNRVDAVWRLMHQTESGRKTLHGALKHKVVGDKKVTYVYADGYEHVEPMVKTDVKPKKRPKKVRPPKKPGRLSERQWQHILKKEAAKKQKPVTVTVDRVVK